MKKKMNKTWMEKLASVRIERSAYELAVKYKADTGISITRFISGLIIERCTMFKTKGKKEQTEAALEDDMYYIK